ncbi:hypothetical protein LAZ67_9001606 [Cordylochernes scorpioides]|uniref:DNA helicase Pif1-like 2B domain-containing protein n=1 Tax=Cordylochernes scorpioides TaxID=51811 RepID=A0ABY6KTP1_9ARAC|nr:hypothetical protein LAZ67_9001606 [Cordylochernes scorpioides]
MPPHRLNLKIGAIVMLQRNFNPKQGLCNGTRMVIQRVCSHVLEAQLLTGTKVGHTVSVPKISLAPSDTNLPFILKRRQFPLRLAFAMTINKAQGQTSARVGLLLQEPVFTHGQLYVPFSRVLTLDSIRVKSEKPVETMASPDLTKAEKVQDDEVSRKGYGNRFLGQRGVLLVDFMPKGTTINSKGKCETLKKLRRAIQNKRRGRLTKESTWTDFTCPMDKTSPLPAKQYQLIYKLHEFHEFVLFELKEKWPLPKFLFSASIMQAKMCSGAESAKATFWARFCLTTYPTTDIPAISKTTNDLQLGPLRPRSHDMVWNSNKANEQDVMA